MDSHERADRQRLWPTDQKRTCEPVKNENKNQSEKKQLRNDINQKEQN